MKDVRGRQINHLIFLFFFFAFTFLNAASSFAGPARTTYQAKIIKPDGYPLEASSVNFKFTILDPAGSCILYSETYSSVNMSSTGGLISFSLGAGVKTYPASATTFEQVFSNITSSLSCDAGGPVSYSPLANDSRKIVMQFHDGSGWQTLPAMAINAVPYAMYTNEASKLDGKTASDFVQNTSLATCGAGEALSYNGAGFSCLTIPNPQTVSGAAVISALGYTPADGASVTTLTSSLASANATISSVSSTIASVSSTVSNLSASMAAIVSSQWITSGTSLSYLNGHVGIGSTNPQALLEINGAAAKKLILRDDQNGVSQSTIISFEGATDGAHGWLGFASTADDDLSILAQGTSGDVVLGAGNSFAKGLRIKGATGNVGFGITTPVTRLDVSGGVRIGMESATCAVSYAGTLRYNGAAVEYCNGTTWAAFGVSGAGLQGLNGSTSGTQTFAISTAGSSFAITSLNGVHTFNVPLTNYVLRSNNLSDLTSSATARTNLGLGTFATANTIDLGSASATGTLAVASLANSGVSAGTYTKVTVDGKGRVVSGAQLNTADVTMALGYTPASASASTQWTTSATAIYYNTGAVGIGTVDPQGPLHIYSSSPNAIVLERSNNQNSHIQYKNTAGSVYAGLNTVGSFAIGPNVNLSVTPFMTVQSGTGYVGVGSVSATEKLTVAGNINIPNPGASTDRYIKIAVNGGAEKSYIRFDQTAAPGPSNYWDIGGLSGGNLYDFGFESSGTRRVTITFAGNMGIGVSAPTAKLHLASGTASLAPLKLTSGTLLSSPVSGAIEYDGSYYYITDGTNTRRAIATVANPGTFDNASTLTSPGNIAMVPVGSVVVSSTTQATNSSTGALVVKGGLGVAGNIYASGTIITSSDIQGSVLTATSATITPYIYGSTQSAGNIRIDSTTNSNKGYVLMAPNGGTVEIGTNSSSPVSSASIRFVPTNAGDQSALRFTNNSLANWIQSGVDYTSDSKKDIRFSSINAVTTWMTIQASSGNVGIGATNPASKLSFGAGDSTGNTHKFGVFESAGQTYFYGIGAMNPDGLATGGDEGLGLWGGTETSFPWNGTSGTAAHMFIKRNTGYVGIGNTNPGAKLHVTGNQALENNSNSTSGANIGFWKNRNYGATQNGDELGYISFFGHDGSTTTRSAYIISNTDGTPGGGSSPGNIRFLTTNSGNADSTEKMRITSAGAVGIGTIAPEGPLHVYSNSPNAIILERNSNLNSHIQYKNSVGSVFAGLSPSGNFGIGPNASLSSSPFMTVQSGTGYVGIGLLNPLESLDVSGNAYIRGANIFTANDAGTNTNNDYINYDDNTGLGTGGIWSFNADTSRNQAWTNATAAIAAKAGYLTTNLSVGTSAQTRTLEVNGSINAGGMASEVFSFTVDGTVSGTWAIGSLSNNSTVVHVNFEMFIHNNSTIDALRFQASLPTYSNGTFYPNWQELPVAFGSTAWGGAKNYVIDVLRSSASAGQPIYFRVRNKGGNGSSSTMKIRMTYNSDINFTRITHVNTTATAFNAATAAAGGPVDGMYGALEYSFPVATGQAWRPADNTGLFIKNSGFVGIGTSAPSVELEVSGTVKAQAYLYTSDRRLKKDIITLPDALANVLKLRGVSFVWRNSEEKTMGFIAQEVEEVYPELVKTDKASGFKAVQYGNIAAILVEAIKQENKERLAAQNQCEMQLAEVKRSVASVEEKSADRMNKLEKENQDLKSRLEKLEKLLLKK